MSAQWHAKSARDQKTRVAKTAIFFNKNNTYIYIHILYLSFTLIHNILYTLQYKHLYATLCYNMQYAVNIMPSPVIKDVASTPLPPSDPKTPMLRASSRLIWHGNEKWARLGWSESQQCIIYQRKKETKIGAFYLKKQRHFIDMMFIITLCTWLNYIHIPIRMYVVSILLSWRKDCVSAHFWHPPLMLIEAGSVFVF